MIKEFQYKGHNIRINQGYADTESPREYEPYGTLITFHSRYDYSDSKKPELDTGDFSGWDDVKEHLIKKEGAQVILPVYLYDHSSQALSTEPFSCPFDSGRLGFIYATRADILDGCGRKRLTKKLKDDAVGYLKSEVDTLNAWINDDCYALVVDPVDDADEEGIHEVYGGGLYSLEEAEREGRASVDRLVDVEEELLLIKNLTPEELPKHINTKWRFPHVSDSAFKKRLKEEG